MHGVVQLIGILAISGLTIFLVLRLLTTMMATLNSAIAFGLGG